MIEIKKYNSITTEYQLSKKLLESLELSDLLEQKNRETLFIKDICKRVEKSKTVLYVLKKDNKNLGLISISSIAKNIQENIGLKYIVLLPDNKDLEKIYKELNFNKLNKTGWMFISI